jgi:hypothetical protein
MDDTFSKISIDAVWDSECIVHTNSWPRQA